MVYFLNMGFYLFHFCISFQDQVYLFQPVSILSCIECNHHTFVHLVVSLQESLSVSYIQNPSYSSLFIILSIIISVSSIVSRNNSSKYGVCETSWKDE